MEITGKLHSIGEVKTFPSGFMLEEFYLDLTRFDSMTGEKYSNHAKFQNANERLNLQQFNIGDVVKLSFSIRGNSFAKEDGSTGFAQNLNAYKIELVKAKSDSDSQGDDEQDDLPFR